MKNLTEAQVRTIIKIFTTPAPKGGKIEKEMRFGCFVSVAKGSFKQFQPGVSEGLFASVLTKLQKYGGTFEKSVTAQYDSGLRITRFFWPDGSERIEYDMKSKSKSNEFDLREYGLRFSGDVEIPLPDTTNPPTIGPTHTRERERYTIQQPRYRFELSKVLSGSRISFEIEVEFTHDYTSVQELHTDIVKIYNTVYDPSGRDAIRSFNRFTGEATDTDRNEACITFKAPKPEDFNVLSFMDSVDKPYGVTIKADGLHSFAMVEGTKFHILQLPESELGLSFTIDKKLPPFIIEGERLTDPASGLSYFCAFDLIGYYASGKGYQDTRPLSYKERYTLLQSIIPKLLFLPIALKKVLFSDSAESLYSAVDKLVSTRTHFFEVAPQTGYGAGKFAPIQVYSFEDDGLIFTPDIPYSDTVMTGWVDNDSKYRPVIRKLKPLDKLTLDLLYLGGRLYASGQQGRVEFSPPGLNPVKIDKKKLRLEEGQVGEFTFSPKHNRLELYRIRSDKAEGNYIGVVNKIWKLFQDPLDIATAAGRSIRLVRKHHNAIKANLIKSVLSDSGATVLDLGGGAGGDLSKYEAAGVKTLLYVEPNSDNLAELERRLAAAPPKTMKVYTLQAYGQETDTILKFIREKTGKATVDAVAMFFSLTFFFGDDRDLKALAATITGALKKDGVFLGTYTRGSAVEKLLKRHSGVYSTPAFKLSYGANKTSLTAQIELEIPGTIVGRQTEYLVDMNLLARSLPGFTLNQDIPFPGHPAFNKPMNDFNGLYNSFVFSRKGDEKPGPQVPKSTTIKQTPVQFPEGQGVSTFKLRRFTGPDALISAVLSLVSSSFRDDDNTVEFISRFRTDRGLKKMLIAARPFMKGISQQNPKEFAAAFARGEMSAMHIEFLCHFIQHNIIIISGDGPGNPIASINGRPSLSPIELYYDSCLLLVQSKEEVAVLGQSIACVPDYRERFTTGSDLINELMRKKKLLR